VQATNWFSTRKEKRLKRILVAIDGSTAADKALEVALDLATQHEAEIRLLHVLLRDKEPAELLRLADLAHARKDLVVELTCLARQPFSARSAAEIMRNPSAPDRPVPAQVLRKIGAYLLKRAGVLAETRCIRAEALKLADGPVAQTITATAVAEQADTIVMGSRGLSLIDALGFGSASQEVFRSAPCTCIAVH
jgi:nucleotide-binding universal stress UspA family protein